MFIFKTQLISNGKNLNSDKYYFNINNLFKKIGILFGYLN